MLSIEKSLLSSNPQIKPSKSQTGYNNANKTAVIPLMCSLSSKKPIIQKWIIGQKILTGNETGETKTAKNSGNFVIKPSIKLSIKHKNGQTKSKIANVDFFIYKSPFNHQDNLYVLCTLNHCRRRKLLHRGY